MRKIVLAAMALAPVFSLVVAAGISAADIPDAPLEPAIESSEEQGLTPGSILEFWFAPVGRFERMPVEPSVTGMIDDSDKVFSGNAMLKDPEM